MGLAVWASSSWRHCVLYSLAHWRSVDATVMARRLLPVSDVEPHQ